MHNAYILVAGAEESVRRRLTPILDDCGFEAIEAIDRASAFAALKRRAINAAIVDAEFGYAGGGLAFGSDLASQHRIPVLLIGRNGSEQMAVSAFRAGFADYLKLPLDPSEVSARVGRFRLISHDGPSGLRRPDREPVQAMVGASPAMRELRTYLMKVASTDSNALITGETGTGKELAAELIHRNSRRRDRPFIRINCAAIPDGLLESELFGHERGSFTGAYARQEGALKQADGGTVFFDEIGDMSPFAQAKILRAIESREVRRLGGCDTVALDIRVIAATNQDLEALVEQQRFRRDLFFRLHVASVRMPSLRTRKEDLLELCHCYLCDMNRRRGLAIEGFAPETLDALLRHDWPGNVRELKNLIEAVFIDPPSRVIKPENLPASFQRLSERLAANSEHERDRMVRALLATNWNKCRAAEQLKWSRMTLYRKMNKYRIFNAARPPRPIESSL